MKKSRSTKEKKSTHVRSADARKGKTEPDSAAAGLSATGAPPMATAAVGPGGNWDASVSDTAVLGGRCAANAAERHVTLDHAVGNVWAAEDIGTIWRVESGGSCMWVMSRRGSAPPS